MSLPCFKRFTGFTPNLEQKLTPFPCPKAPKWLGFCPSFSPRTFSSLAPLQPYWPLLFSSILNLPNTPPPPYLEPCQCFYTRDILLSWSILNLPNSPLPLYLEPCQSFYMRDSFPISKYSSAAHFSAQTSGFSDMPSTEAPPELCFIFLHGTVTTTTISYYLYTY